MAKEIIKATLDGHTFELRKVRVDQQHSEEMTAFSADIYIDDKLVGNVSNSGQGESNETHILPDCQKAYAEIAELVEKRSFYAAGHPGQAFRLRYDIDTLTTMMVEAAYFEDRSDFPL